MRRDGEKGATEVDRVFATLLPRFAVEAFYSTLEAIDTKSVSPRFQLPLSLEGFRPRSSTSSPTTTISHGPETTPHFHTRGVVPRRNRSERLDPRTPWHFALPHLDPAFLVVEIGRYRVNKAFSDNRRSRTYTAESHFDNQARAWVLVVLRRPIFVHFMYGTRSA